jgi:DNA-binding MarR family transcriptional regulator
LRATARDDARAAQDQRRLLNRLRLDLLSTFPAAMEIAGEDLAAPTLLRLLERWPTPDSLAGTSRHQLVEFARQSRHGWPERFADRVAQAMAGDHFQARPGLVRAKAESIRLASSCSSSASSARPGSAGWASSCSARARDTQFMNLLDLYGPLTAGQLAELTGLSTGTVTGVLDRLEQSGYAQRGRDLEDRRKVVVTLGVERITREIAPLYEPQADQLSRVLARHSPSELNLIADFVSRFADASTPRPADALRRRQGADALDKRRQREHACSEAPRQALDAAEDPPAGLCRNPNRAI